jgi:ABC-type phosphate transport system permease subunit
VHYALVYIALFALPLVGTLRLRVPGWLKAAAAAGLFASLVSLSIAVIPIVDVVSKEAYAFKIVSVVLLTNAAGFFIYRAGVHRAGEDRAGQGPH